MLVSYTDDSGVINKRLVEGKIYKLFHVVVFLPMEYKAFRFQILDQSIDTTNHRCLLVILSIFHYTTDLIINITYINISLYHIIHYELKSINIINMDFIKPSQYSIDFP